MGDITSLPTPARNNAQYVVIVKLLTVLHASLQLTRYRPGLNSAALQMFWIPHGFEPGMYNLRIFEGKRMSLS